MAGAGVVDRDIGRAFEAGVQYRGVLGLEGLEPGGQKAHHLALRDHHRHAPEQRQDLLARHMALKMKHQDQAMQIGAIAPDKAGIERRDPRFPVRRLPALTPIAGYAGVQNHILNDDVLIALAARARRRLDFDDHGSGDRQLVEVAPAPLSRSLALGPLGLGLRPVRRLVHPRGFLRRSRRQVLQPRELVLDRLMLDPQLGKRALQLLAPGPKSRHFVDQSANDRSQLRLRQLIERIIRSGRRHPDLESQFQDRDSSPLPGNLPRLLKSDRLLVH
jgi:hypothetical protein